MFATLPYRAQIPLGLSVAVVVAALLVTAVTARITARNARQDSLATVDRAVVLLSAQARPLLAADDTWRVFALLRDTAALLPGAAAAHARAAILDTDGRVFAASDPARLDIGRKVLGETVRGQAVPAASRLLGRLLLDEEDVAILIEPIRSEDGQVQGFAYVEVDGTVFAPDWVVLSQPALIGSALACILLVPALVRGGRPACRAMGRGGQRRPTAGRFGHRLGCAACERGEGRALVFPDRIWQRQRRGGCHPGRRARLPDKTV